MTREIKFKARLKVRLGELPIGSWVYFTIQEPSFNNIIDWSTLCEFTGKHDRHGKEVYEGDILQMRVQIKGWHTIKAKIEYQSGGFWFVGIDFNITDCNWHFYNAEDREVIGNIYESPELLKEGNGGK